MKLAIGTAQFGSSYGVANTSGILTEEEINKILDSALIEGIDTIDTARSYGESEIILGNSCVSSFRVITKLPAVPDNCLDIEKWVDSFIVQSLKALKVKNIYGVLFHNPDQLLSNYGEDLYKALERYKKNGVILKIGISIYSPSQLDLIMPKFSVDIVQTPFNIIDRRILNSGWLEKLSNKNIEIHIRSVFLQGLLLMEYEKIPSHFSKWNSVWSKWKNWLTEREVSAIHACISFVGSFQEVDKIIVGFDSLTHFEQIIDASKKLPLKNIINIELEDELLINPSNWR
jgi:aryl-alcohol dehydrogenase-like predicted oxidoreductase